jgi:hypothetical protein
MRYSRLGFVAVGLALGAAIVAPADAASFTPLVDSRNWAGFLSAGNLNDNGTIVFKGATGRGIGIYTSDGQSQSVVISPQGFQSLFSTLPLPLAPSPAVSSPAYRLGNSFAINNTNSVAYSAIRTLNFPGGNLSETVLFKDQTQLKNIQTVRVSGYIDDVSFDSVDINNQGQVSALARGIAAVGTPSSYSYEQVYLNDQLVDQGARLRFGPRDTIGAATLSDQGLFYNKSTGFIPGPGGQVVPPEAVYRVQNGVKTLIAKQAISSLTASDNGTLLWTTGTGADRQAFVYKDGVAQLQSGLTFGGALINNSGAIAYQDLAKGIFRRSGTQSERIIGIGDSLFGSVVQNLSLTGFNNKGQMAFTATLNDGVQVIVRTDDDQPQSVPEPMAAIGLVLVGGRLLGRSRSVAKAVSRR